MITFVTHLRAAPGNEPALAKLLGSVGAATRANEPGVIHYDFAVSAEDAALFVVIEVYRDADAQASHMQTAWVTDALPQTMALVEGPVDVRQYVSPGTAPVVSRFGKRTET